MFLERLPVNHLIHRLHAGCKTLSVQPAHPSSGPTDFPWMRNPSSFLAAHGTSHLVTGQCTLENISAVLHCSGHRNNGFVVFFTCGLRHPQIGVRPFKLFDILVLHSLDVRRGDERDGLAYDQVSQVLSDHYMA